MNECMCKPRDPVEERLGQLAALGGDGWVQVCLRLLGAQLLLLVSHRALPVVGAVGLHLPGGEFSVLWLPVWQAQQ